MNIIYTRHVKQRMAQRHVSPDEIRETLETPDEILPGDFDEEMAIKQYGHREIRVVYRQTADDTYLIITVMKPRLLKRTYFER